MSRSRADRREPPTAPGVSNTWGGGETCASTDRHRWTPSGTVCDVERQYRDRPASLERPFDSANWEVGVEAGEVRGCRLGLATASRARARHRGNVLGERAFEHGGAGLSELADCLLSFTAGETGGIGVAVDTPRGPVVESLIEGGLVVHSINPKQLDRFQDRFSPAGAKNERRDARVSGLGVPD